MINYKKYALIAALALLPFIVNAADQAPIQQVQQSEAAVKQAPVQQHDMSQQNMQGQREFRGQKEFRGHQNYPSYGSRYAPGYSGYGTRYAPGYSGYGYRFAPGYSGYSACNGPSCPPANPCACGPCCGW